MYTCYIPAMDDTLLAAIRNTEFSLVFHWEKKDKIKFNIITIMIKISYF
jgi:hypothetical protein